MINRSWNSESTKLEALWGHSKTKLGWILGEKFIVSKINFGSANVKVKLPVDIGCQRNVRQMALSTSKNLRCINTSGRAWSAGLDNATAPARYHPLQHAVVRIAFELQSTRSRQTGVHCHVNALLAIISTRRRRKKKIVAFFLLAVDLHVFVVATPFAARMNPVVEK